MATAAVTNTLVNGATITHSEHNTNYGDLVSFLNDDVVHRDGSKVMTGALAMGGNKVTGLATPVSTTDASTKKYVDDEIAAIDLSGKQDVITNLGNFVKFQNWKTGSLSALSGAWADKASHTVSRPAGWGSSLVIAWAEVQYGALPDGAQLNIRVQIDSATGDHTQSGSANSTDGTSGVVSSTASAVHTTSDATINIKVQAMGTVALGGTGKYSTVQAILIRAS